MSKIVLQPSTLITPETGTIEYDGKVPYFTPQGAQRGVIPSTQYYRLDTPLAGTNATGAQSIFGAGATLSTNTIYAFSALYAFSRTTGTTNHSFGIGFGGTSVLNNIAYQINGQYNGTGFTTTTGVVTNLQVSFIQSASNFNLVTGISGGSSYFMFSVTGTVSVNTGGTFIPQYSLSAAPGGAYTTAAGCYFSIYPIGTAGSNTSIGTWT